MCRLNLTVDERKAIEFIERRDYHGLEKFLEQHEFNSGLLKAIWNFGRFGDAEDDYV